MDLSGLTRPVERLVATAQNGLEVLRFGGLRTDAVSSPSQIVESVPMYRLRRYFPPGARVKPAKQPVLLVHPMMLSAGMWDVTRDGGAVGVLHAAGLDPWVIDFGSPDRVEGGMRRTLADHVAALSEAVDTVKAATGLDVHLAGYSQGGMFCYQAGAYRRSRDLASIITFGAPVDTLAALPLGIPAGFAVAAADFMADHVFNRIDIPGWLARTGFQLLDPVKTAQARIDFVRQLHDRAALLPREQQRRFLASDGWIAWSGPAISELLKQFVAHNRMMTGGFAVNGELVTLTDIECPVLAFVGEVDDIGQPASVRGIKRAAPKADVYEFLIRTGHFGLIVGSRATDVTWPTVVDWVRWSAGEDDLPAGIVPMAQQPLRAGDGDGDGGVALVSRVAHGAAVTTEMAVGLIKSAADTVFAADRSARALAVETVRTLPRLARLGQINDHTRISLGAMMAEQSRGAPKGECLLFDGRVHTYEAVGRRIDNVVRGLIAVGVRQGAHVGVLMQTRPSALVAITALSRLGAVAVLMPPGADLAAAARIGGISQIITDPGNLKVADALGLQVLVLGGGEARDLDVPAGAGVIDMERINPETVDLPGWYRPDPGLARDLAFVAFSTVGGELLARQITNHRWALSAFGTASSANLGRGDTVYCLTPLHHQSGLLVSLGGAVAGGSRIALARGLPTDGFVDEIRQYGVTVVSYTWAMLREVIEAIERDPDEALAGNHPVRLFIGSGMPTGLWRRVVDVFAPARVVEFFSTTDGQAVLANVSGAKIGAKGRPLPGGGQVELAAYDPLADLICEDDRGFVQRARPTEVGVLLAHPRGPIDPTASVERGVFAAGDTWISTEYLFRRDGDGDFWLVDTRASVVRTDRGAVYTEPVTDAVSMIDAVDLAVTYGVSVRDRQVAVTALTLRPGARVSAGDLALAMTGLAVGEPPDVVHVVPELTLSASYRPTVGALRDAGIPKASRNAWYLDPRVPGQDKPGQDKPGHYQRLTAAARAGLAGSEK